MRVETVRSLLPHSSDLCLFLSLSLVLLGACGGEGIILPGDGEPAEIAIVEGDKQRGRVGEPLTDPLVVEVTDARGRPVAGATVAFELTSAGSEVVPHEKSTDANGLADARVVLGTTVGPQTGKARVVTPEGQPPVQADFTAMALPEDAISMAAVAGQDQTGHVGQPLDDRLVVEVTDGFGNPVAGVPITWSAEGGGTVSASVVATDEDGRSRVERTLGPAVGQQTTVATSEELAGSPVTFVHTALAGDASRLVIVSGNDQTAEAGTVLPEDPVVRLVDSEGNGVPGTAVTWLAAIGGGSVAPENSTTDGDGRTSARWTLGGTLGGQRLDAVVSGVGVASFHATATAGAPASLFIRTQPSSTAQNGIPFARQPVIQVRDPRGNDVAVAGIQVRASLSGGGELRGTLVIGTDAQGRASFTDLAISGDAGTRTLFFEAEGYAGVTSSAIDVAAAPNRAPSASFTFTCVNLACSFNSEGSSDPDGSIVSWAWTFGDGGADNARNPSHTYGGGGTYQVALTVTDDDGATNSLTRSVTVSGPPTPNQPPSASFTSNCANLVCSFNSDGSSDPDGRIVDWAWSFGDGESSDSRNPGHRYDDAGTYQVTLTVTDNGGVSGSAGQSVTVTAPPPENKVPDADYNWTCQGLTCHFTDESDDDDGEVVAWAWDFGGSGTSVAQNPTHRFPGPAEYQVTLTVTDNGGATDLSTASVEVRKADSDINITSFVPEEPVVGEPVRIQFVVTGEGGTPTGDVTVTADDPGETCTGTVAAGFCDLTFTAPGDRDITATYGGDGGFEGSSDGEDIQVDPATPANLPPTAVDDAATTTAETTVEIPVLLNDTDPEGASLTITNVGTPGNGSAVPNGTSITYTPNPGFSGSSDLFTYTVSDGSLADDATVTVTVNPATPPGD